MTRVLVCGGRDYTDYATVSYWLDLVSPDEVIHGGARGADSLSGKWAAENGVTCRVYPALWSIHGNSAGPIRNQEMLDAEDPHLVLAFPGGTGTAHMVRIAKAAGYPVWEVEEE